MARVDRRSSLRRAFAPFLLSAVLACSGAACSHKTDATLPTPGSVDADKFLFDRGNDSLQNKKWLAAREYFKKLIDTYPQSPYRSDAKLGVGDSYLGERRSDSLILGVNEFKEFLQYFPLNPRADYAQYKMCLAESQQMLGPQRDQTATREAIRDCDAFVTTYPDSKLRPEVEKVRRAARDRLSESEYEIGRSYFRQRWYPGAIGRLTALAKDDPDFTNIDGVYFYLGESYYKSLNEALALPNYAKVVESYPKSEYFKQAQARIATIKIKH